MPAHRHLSTMRSLVALTSLGFALGAAGCKSSSPPADDATLTAAVQSRIAGDGVISSEPIQSSVQSGIVTLTGNVSSDNARSAAAADAAQIAGIKTVVNNLSVQQPPPPATAAVPLPPPVATKKTPATSTAKPKPAPVVRQPAPVENTAQAAPSPPPAQAPPPVGQAAPPPPRPAPPAFRNITIPAETTLPIRITPTLDSATTQQGDPFTGTIATDITLDNMTVLRQGTQVRGRVSVVHEAAHYKGGSLLTVELTSIDRRGEKIPVTTYPYSVQGKSRGGNTATKVSGGAAVGAILGGILGGGKGAAIGAAAGGGAGAGANAITRGEQVQITSETLIRFQLNNPLTVRVSTAGSDSPATSPELQPRPQNQQPQ
jgi:BON domain